MMKKDRGVYKIRRKGGSKRNQRESLLREPSAYLSGIRVNSSGEKSVLIRENVNHIDGGVERQVEQQAEQDVRSYVLRQRNGAVPLWHEPSHNGVYTKKRANFQGKGHQKGLNQGTWYSLQWAEKYYNVMCWVYQCMRQHTSYLVIHLLYICSITMIGTVCLYLREKHQLKFIDALFMCVSSSTMAGLVSVDISSFSILGHWILLITILLCSNILLSGAPLVVRCYCHRQKTYSALKALKWNFADEAGIKTFLRQSHIEYQALLLLLKCVLIYFIAVPMLSILFIGVSLSLPNQQSYSTIENSFENKTIPTANPFFFALFHSVSAFNNVGFGLHKDNMMPFVKNPAILVPMSFLILLGNTYYPLAVYAIVWVLNHYRNWRESTTLSKTGVLRVNDERNDNEWETYSSTEVTQYLLDNPQYCFMHMFPLRQSISLFYLATGILFLNIGVFLLLDYNKPYLQHLSPATRLLVAWFQNVSTRNAGFACIDLYKVSETVKLLWVLLMYVIAYPMILAVKTNIANARHSMYPTSLIHCTPPSPSTNVKASTIIRSQSSIRQDVRENPAIPKRFSCTASIQRCGSNAPQSIAMSPKNTRAMGNIFPLRSVPLPPVANPAVCSESTHSTNKNFYYSTSFATPRESLRDEHADTVSQIVAYQVYRICLQDIFWLFLIILLICICEDANFPRQSRLTVFSIIFETVSAYGTVGLSLGYDPSCVSLSGILSPLSKLLVIITMMLGRHRSLPLTIDCSVNFHALFHNINLGVSPTYTLEHLPDHDKESTSHTQNATRCIYSAPRSNLPSNVAPSFHVSLSSHPYS